MMRRCGGHYYVGFTKAGKHGLKLAHEARDSARTNCLVAAYLDEAVTQLARYHTDAFLRVGYFYPKQFIGKSCAKFSVHFANALDSCDAPGKCTTVNPSL